MEAKAARREPLQPTQVLHDRDASRQQRRVHRTRRAAGVIDVDRVDPDQSGLLLDQPVGGGSGQEGAGGAAAPGAPVAIAAGVDQHGPAPNLVGRQHAAVDHLPPSSDPHYQAVKVGDAVKRQASHIGGAGEAVERAVEVGAGVGHHPDAPDLELGAWPVAGGGGFPGQVVADLGSGQSRIGDHAVADLVAQLDQTRPRRWRIRRPLRRLARLGSKTTHRPFRRSFHSLPWVRLAPR
jgi:hypothetical protein